MDHCRLLCYAVHYIMLLTVYTFLNAYSKPKYEESTLTSQKPQKIAKISMLRSEEKVIYYVYIAFPK